MDIQVPSVSINDMIEGEYTIIDVRTPKEFDEFHIPGAFNLPIFSNEQRVQIGTAYKQKGPETAKEMGLEFVSKKLPNLFTAIKQHDERFDRPIAIHCWRGGMRSRSLVTVMNALGVSCCQLDGGIRSFRRRIVEDLENFKETLPPFIVLEGHTGTRKTDMLLELKRNDYPILDLEGLAGHRGSVFGGIGLVQKSQKQFECDLWRELSSLQNEPYILIEAESKRIGRVSLPECILNRKQTGRRIHVSYPFQKRVRTLCKTYEPEKHHSEIESAVDRLKKRVDPELNEQLQQALGDGDYEQVVSILLESYYDPKYSFSEKQYGTPVEYIQMEHFRDGVIELKQILSKIS
jgi:tRNA 2-selenouridine synthase